LRAYLLSITNPFEFPNTINPSIKRFEAYIEDTGLLLFPQHKLVWHVSCEETKVVNRT
jgi:hypothetical protein